MVAVDERPLRRCRSLVARLVLGHAQRRTADARLGSFVLRPHQLEAVRRVVAQLDRHRGCLLADDVGRGKTLVALALARRWARSLIVIPASLRDTWDHAMRGAATVLPVITHESLSRGALPAGTVDGIIVDEAHRFRNPGTRRHAALAELCACSELVLLTATPVQNSSRDLAAQLALFLGGVALALPPEALVRHVVRVDAGDEATGLPRVEAPVATAVDCDDTALLQALLDLPAPPRALDAGDAGALRTISLVRAWASSRAALRSALARRRRVATAIEQGALAGRLPTRAELSSWNSGDDADIQLGLPELLVSAHQPANASIAVAEAARAELSSLAAIASRLRHGTDADLARASALLALVRAHPERRVLAFTERASTARMYHTLLNREAGVGLLTATEARIASGRLSRRELLARFAPIAMGCPEPPARERVTLLIATDLLSEGMNLQDASVVVHLDLPWNPARLAQRVGRVRRPGGSAHVLSFVLSPPAASEVLLAVESRLRRKLSDAERLVGRSLPVMPRLVTHAREPADDVQRGAAAAAGAVHARIATWRAEDCGSAPSRDGPAIACAASVATGWLAVTVDGRLLASAGGHTGDDALLLDDVTRLAEGCAACGDDCHRRGSAMREARAWLSGCALLDACGVSHLASDAGRAVARELEAMLRRMPLHERAGLVTAAAAVRHALHGPIALGAERALGRLLVDRRAIPPAEWMAHAQAIVGAARGQFADEPTPVVAALIVFHPGA